MTNTAPLRTTLRRIGLVAVLAMTMSACVAIYRDHGYVPSESDLSAITPGRDTRESVRAAVGTPGASGVLNAGGYYYVATRMRHYGGFEPTPVSRELVAISFNGRGVVSGIERFGLQDGRVIPLERRVTDNGAQDKTFLRQLLGNLGRIGPGQILDN